MSQDLDSIESRVERIELIITPLVMLACFSAAAHGKLFIGLMGLVVMSCWVLILIEKKAAQRKKRRTKQHDP